MNGSPPLFLLFPVFLVAQEKQENELLAPIHYFTGEWEGVGEGRPGIARVARTYRPVLNGKFVEAENVATYAPQVVNPKGEVHEDIGYFSYDRVRKTIVLRQFHGEGFVNQYVLDSLSADGTVILFQTERIENIPAGWRARELYQIMSDSEFVETFLLSPPGKEFDMYSTTRFTRKQP